VLVAISLLSVAAFSVLVFASSVHLLFLARRTGKRPELLLGLCFLLSLLGNGGVILGLGTEVLAPDARIPTIHISALVLNAGFAFAAIFNARVYRPGVLWASVLAVVLTVGLLGSQAYAWSLGGTSSDHLWLLWLKFGLRGACYVWGAVESLRYYALMRRRLRHGLSGAVTTNRFLLWGIASVLGLLMLSGFEFARWLGFDTALGASLMIGASVIGAPAAGLFWLTFFAPTGYRQLLERKSGSRSGEGAR
jgi:hypothetical protein